MANPEHLKILKKGYEVWNKWRKENLDIVPDLSESTIEGENLKLVNFNGTNFKKAKLYACCFAFSDLNEVDFSNSNLCLIDFSGCEFQNTNFNHAYLIQSNFNGCDLGNSDFRETLFEEIVFSNCDFKHAKNLETSRYIHHSIIDHRTLAKSGNLPLKFLRGVGLPDEIIDLIPVFQGGAINFYSCFISHSSKDHEFANRLYSDLQNNGVRCWFAPEDMKAGKKLFHQINEAIRVHDKLLLIISEESMQSNWVQSEIKGARKRELKEGRQMLFPIGVTPYKNIESWVLEDSDEGRDLAAEVRSYYIPDFSDWKNHDNYKKAFDKLIKSLKGDKK